MDVPGLQSWSKDEYQFWRAGGRKFNKACEKDGQPPQPCPTLPTRLIIDHGRRPYSRILMHVTIAEISGYITPHHRVLRLSPAPLWFVDDRNTSGAPRSRLGQMACVMSMFDVTTFRTSKTNNS